MFVVIRLVCRFCGQIPESKATVNLRVWDMIQNAIVAQYKIRKNAGLGKLMDTHCQREVRIACECVCEHVNRVEPCTVSGPAAGRIHVRRSADPSHGHGRQSAYGEWRLD